MDGRFVSYLRVSTARQGASGLGLEAQRKAVADYLNGGSWELLAEFQEVESGKHDDRPQLAAALERCRLTGAKLVIAKLDRLSRDLEFLARLTKGDVEFVACDMPGANRFTIHVMASLAQQEREMISARTKAGLAEIKAKLARGEEHVSAASGKPVEALGGFRGYVPSRGAGAPAKRAVADAFANRVAPMLVELKAQGASLATMAAHLNGQHIQTARGSTWTPTAVKRVLDRLAPSEA